MADKEMYEEIEQANKWIHGTKRDLGRNRAGIDSDSWYSERRRKI